jgi:hypothetical protein
VVNNSNLVELFIKYLPDCYLREVKTYQPVLENNIPPYTNQTLAVIATASNPFTFQINAANNPTNFSITDTNYNWITVSNTGTFTGIPPTTGIFFVPFFISNSYGSTYYSLNITVSS